MDIARTRQWAAILNLSHNMLKAAHAQAWDRLVKLEHDRRSRINRFFARVTEPEEILEITEGTHKILEIDNEIVAISKKQREVGNLRSSLSKQIIKRCLRV